MGSDGWLALGWPKEYGGQGATTTEQLMFLRRHCWPAPHSFVTLNTVGPALIDYGTEMKKSFSRVLPPGKYTFVSATRSPALAPILPR